MSPLGERIVTGSPAPVVTVPVHPAPDVSLITVTYGTGEIVIDMIASVVGSLATSAVTFEVVVVDNPHPIRPARTQVELQLFTAGVTVVTPDRNLGFGGGCELGALHAAGRVLGFVNPDIIATGDWIAPLLRTLRPPDRTPPSIVAPVLLDPDGSVQEVGQRILSNGHTRPNTELGPGSIEVDYASAACWLIERDEHERLGGFDPAYHPAYFEDVDLALRARRNGGGTVVNRDVTVVHRRGSGTPDDPVPAMRQLETLLRTWPEIAWRQPPPPD